MRRLLAVPALAVLLVLTLRPAGAAAEVAPQQDELLRISSDITYSVLPEAGPPSVTWQVDIQNNDPSTTYREFGTIYFYQNLTVPILRGATDVAAAGPNGAPLSVSLDRSGDEALIPATVWFNRELFFGESYALTLSYDLGATRSDTLLVTEAYVFFPAIAFGDTAQVTIETPSGGGWDSTLEPVGCSEAGGAPGTYTCSAPDAVEVAALVEVLDPDALQSTELTVDLANGPLDVNVSSFPGEDAWAAGMEEIARSALPLLEELFGFPYDGPRALLISERGRQDIAGYEGTFRCIGELSCEIGISPVASDLVAVHELAHLWTEDFENRWIAEGLAEFTSRRAANMLGTLVEGQSRIEPARVVDMRLDEWGRPTFLIGAQEQQRAREESGYYYSLRFFETLERTVGLEAIQAANAAAVEYDGIVDSEKYFDLLEEASGERLDELFLGRVFPQSFASTLEQRRTVRDRLALVRLAAAEADLELPTTAATFVDDWRFNEAEDELDEAQAALDTYISAGQRVDAPHSLWERIGLIGENPESKIRQAAVAFEEGDFERAIELAEEAESTVDGASRAALIRVLIAVAVVGAAILLLGGGIFFFLSRRRPAHA